MRKVMRISEADEPLSLNSLLDTLMNVVGVSLILLAAANLNLIKTTKQIESSEIPQDIAQKLMAEQAESKPTADQVDPAPNETHSEPDDAEERKRLLARLAVLEGEPARVQMLLDKLEATQRSLKELRDEDSSLDAKIHAQRADVGKLSAERSGGAHGATIQLPVMRTISRQLEPVTVVCRNGRAYVLDALQLNKALGDAFQAAGRRLTPTMSGVEQLRSLVSYFDSADVGNQNFRITVKPAIESQRFRGFVVAILPRKTAPAGGGLAGSSSEDIAVLQHLNPATQYVHFLVWADSFQFYLSLRGEIEKYYSNEGNRGTRIGLSWTAYALDEEITRFIPADGSSPQSGGDEKGTKVDN